MVLGLVAVIGILAVAAAIYLWAHRVVAIPGMIYYPGGAFPFGPDKKPVFYRSREAGCASLDRDSLGRSTSQITLADGSTAQSESNKETATIRCIAPGHYDIGVNLYSDRELAKGANTIPVRVEITGLNPQVTTLFAGNVVLDQVGQTINVASFDLTYDGQVKLTDPPLEPITHAYERAK